MIKMSVTGGITMFNNLWILSIIASPTRNQVDGDGEQQRRKRDPFLCIFCMFQVVVSDANQMFSRFCFPTSREKRCKSKQEYDYWGQPCFLDFFTKLWIFVYLSLSPRSPQKNLKILWIWKIIIHQSLRFIISQLRITCHSLQLHIIRGQMPKFLI